MRTALAASVAAAAKGIFLAVLGLVVVLERRSLSSGAAGTRFARPVPQPESRRIDLPEQVKSLLIMRTALAICVAAVAKWISGAASLGLQVVPKRWSMWSMAAGADAKRNGFVCPIMRIALASSVAAVAKWISGAAPLGVQAVPERRSV